MHLNSVETVQNSLDRSGWMLPFRFICGNERHFGNAFQCGTMREKMEGILEMPSISGQRAFPSR